MFIKKYEELLDKGYCNCNEMNCLGNDTPRRILNIVKGTKLEAKQLLEERQKLRQENQELDNRLTKYTSLYREEQEKNRRALEYIEAQENFVDYKGYDNSPEQELYDVVAILKGEDSEN